MVMASARATIDDVQAARSDPTIRGFAAEALTDERRGEGETSVWGTQQDAEYKFCKFCPCTWQSFGTRAGDGVPHAFEARKQAQAEEEKNNQAEEAKKKAEEAAKHKAKG